MQKNDDLAYQVLDYIREHPEDWDQAYYFCGTTACFAGWAVRLNAFNENRLTTRYEQYDPALTARRLLGWSMFEAITVFSNMTRDFSELEHLVKSVMNGEVQEADRGRQSTGTFNPAG